MHMTGAPAAAMRTPPAGAHRERLSRNGTRERIVPLSRMRRHVPGRAKGKKILRILPKK
jgi:hypothetical protein